MRSGFWFLIIVSIIFCAPVLAAPPTYTISGIVTTAEGVGVEGIDVMPDGGITATTTAGDGSYSITVPKRWTGTVTVSKTGWLITPASRNYPPVDMDYTGQNYIAYQPKISGVVTKSNGTPLAGAVVTADNGGGYDTTDTNGYYKIIIPYDWSGSVSVTLTGYHFTDKNYTNVITDQANQNFSGYQPTISGSTNVTGATVTVSGVGVITSTPNYTVTVPYGWSGTITAELAGYDFTNSPLSFANVTTDLINQDFTPYQPTISGTITQRDGTPVTDMTVTADNGGGTGTTDASGYYEVVVPYNWSGQVSANKIKWDVTPESYSYVSLTSNQIDQDFTATYLTTIIVKADGTGHVSTIQEAIDIAVDGDIVQVEDGTYTGDGNRDIDFLGKAITVRGNVADPNLVVIDCQASFGDWHRGFRFIRGETENSILEGIKIIHGYGTEEIVDGHSICGGGGISCYNSSPTIQSCVISSNGSAGIYIYGLGSSATISNCTVSSNSGSGIACINYCDPTIKDSNVVNNSGGWGGGIHNSENSNPQIINCIISSNSASSGGAGIFNETSNPIIRNCTINVNVQADFAKQPDVFINDGMGMSFK